MSDNSESSPKGVSITGKKKKPLFSFRRKGSKNYKDIKISGTDSDFSSTNSAAPQITPQNTLKKKVSVPWKNENSEEPVRETAKIKQVSGKKKLKFSSALPLEKDENNIKSQLVQISTLSKPENESGETRSEHQKQLTFENLFSNVKVYDDESIPDRTQVLQEDIQITFGVNESIEAESPTPTPNYYTTFLTLPNERLSPLKEIEGIDIAEGPSKPKNSNVENYKSKTNTLEQLKSIAPEITQAEVIKDIKPFDYATAGSSLVETKLFSMTAEDKKEPVPSVPSVDEVTTRRKITLVTMSGKPEETDFLLSERDSISPYPRIGTKVQSPSIAKVKINPSFNSEETSDVVHLSTISPVSLNQKPKKLVPIESLVKAEIPRYPQPLSNKHYAPFGKAYKPKLPNDKFSCSFSDEISEVDGVKLGLVTSSIYNSSYSNLYINATEARYEPDDGSGASGLLIDPWAFNSSDKKEHLYKILVIGELGTGKTSIIKRYVHQFFCQHYRATIGVDFALKVLNWDENTIIRLQLWDIAGQERFGNMTRVYYKQAVGAFIVFDVSNGRTFDAVTKWKNDLDTKVTLPDGSNIPAVLLANKCDQPKDGALTSPSKMDDYCKERKFAGWFETSAKEDINIDEATKFLISKILNNEKEGLMIDELVDKEKFSIDNEMKIEPEEKKCLC